MEKFPKKLKHGSSESLILEKGHLLVIFKRPRTLQQVERTVSKAGFTCEATTRELETDQPVRRLPLNDTRFRYWIRPATRAKFSGAQLAGLQSELEADVDFVAPVYRVEGTQGDGGLVTPLPDRLLVKPKEGVSNTDLETLLTSLAELGLEESPEKSKYLHPFRYFVVKHPARETAYSLRQKILRQHRRRVAEIKLENVPLVKPLAFVPDDTLFVQQWNLTQINAPDAWDITTGEAEVIIAVLDGGCDLTHPDIRYASNGINVGTMAGTGAPTGANTFDGINPHGTACAGIIAAIINNNAGVAGIAGGCRILPVAVPNWSDAECVAGIRYAIDKGADIINMSFSFYGPNEVPGYNWVWQNFSFVELAIVEAYEAGLVLCAATGNEGIGTFNSFPARHASVIACGASDQGDNRCGFSNFADGVSVVAPGDAIPTTDIQGSQGLATGDFEMNFWGTSAATAHVAGLVALVRSANPLISNKEVRDLIEQNADKVGPVAYTTESGYPNGTRNQDMGYGRINAHSTVEAAAMLFVRKFNDLFNG